MKTTVKIMVCFFLLSKAHSQDSLQKQAHKFVLTSQFAGSTGLSTNGISVTTRNTKLEAGFLYGYLPKKYGGVFHTVSFKFTYNPFKIKLPFRFQWEPIQTGFFITQYSGKNFTPIWEDKYPRGYYWWPKSIRQHIFFSSQLSYKVNNKHLDHIGAYIEANTNDLYLYSYFPSRGSIKLYEIFFLGLGMKVYLK